MQQHQSKTRFLDAATRLIRANGYEATTVDNLCESAELTKGSFFHHFKGKEELAIAAARHFADRAEQFFLQAPFRSLPDPLARLLGYVDLRIAMLQGELPEFTCLLGTMVQETYQSHPPIRMACDRHISEHAALLEADIAEAMRTYRIDASWSAASLALHMQSVIQGAFILAKAKDGTRVASECLQHLRRYLALLFIQPKE